MSQTLDIVINSY